MATMESINAKANAGLATSIATAGAVLLSNGGLDNVLGNLLGGGNNKGAPAFDAMAAALMSAALAPRTCGCESDHVVTRYDAGQSARIAELETRNSLLESNIYTDQKLADVYARLDAKIGVVEQQLCDQKVYNATNTAVIGCIQSQVAQLMGLTKVVVPNSSVCPGWNTTTNA